MGFNCGIVGLPNVGKSTIFSALTATNVDAANYPFCTIEPNTGIVAVPDERVSSLAKVANSQKLIPTTVEFVDIAGLVKGASEGEGLGNQFLGNIRSVDAIVHVVRCFEDDEVTHVDGSPSPRRDVEVIETELLLADMAIVEKRYNKVARLAKTGDKEIKEEFEALSFAMEALSAGNSVRQVSGFADYEEQLRGLGLITAKPVLFAANVDEGLAGHKESEPAEGLLGELQELVKEKNAPMVIISGKVEAEIAALEKEEQEMFLSEIGLEESGLDRLALKGYSLLNLLTFFTIGPKEAHAWTCPISSTAVDAAGVIHTDFAKGFIRAEVIGYDHYMEAGGEQGAKERGYMRLEGKAYAMQDGDVVHFRFNV